MNTSITDSLIEAVFQEDSKSDAKLPHRLIASLLAKRFVLLAGLSGSGKTKLAQSLGGWLASTVKSDSDPFSVGAEIRSSRISYFVRASDSLAVEFWNEEDEESATKVVLPRKVIEEWAAYIRKNDCSDVTAREIREGVKPESRYSDTIHSFETHLKAAALALNLGNTQESRVGEYLVVPVGADWTDNRSVLGFVNYLNEGFPAYQATPILELILRARDRPDYPFFLILDEMNLSHVERYFADFLSVMESQETVLLHSDGENLKTSEGIVVPEKLEIPANLFVIGTVNIDETTYMFSPKVLDRANVIEFAVGSGDIESFLAEPKDYEMAEKASAGMAEGFLALAKQARQLKDGLEGLPEGPKEKVDGHLLALFKILKAHRYEYGYRTAAEVTKYLRVCRHLTDDETKWDAEGWQGSLDEQIVQKLLPKLHGSVGRIGELLAVLGCYCYDGSEKENAKLNDLLNLKEGEELFPKSFAKLQSMAQTLRDEQFVSFIQ